MKPHLYLYMDVEVYPNFALVGLKLPDRATDAATTATHHILAFTSAPGLGETFDAFRNWYAEHCASLNADRDPLRFLILRSTDVSGKQGHAS